MIAPVRPRDLAGKTRRRLAIELIGELEATDKKGLDDRRVGQQGRRMHRNRLCRAAGPEQRREAGGGGAGGKDPVREDGGFWSPGQ